MKLFGVILSAIAVVGIVFLVVSSQHNTEFPTSGLPLNYSQPVYTVPDAIVCPLGLLSDVRADHAPDKVKDMFTSVWFRTEKAKTLGCEELQGSIEVFPMEHHRGVVKVMVIGLPEEFLFTIESELTNQGSQQPLNNSAPDSLADLPNHTPWRPDTRPNTAPENSSPTGDVEETPDSAPQQPSQSDSSEDISPIHQPDSVAVDADRGPFLPGQNGVTFPSCISCPVPLPSVQTLAARVNGTVTLQIVVEADGHATHIQVFHGLGYGLDELAVQAVQNWHFKPALGPTGEPVPTIVPAEIKFGVN